MRSKDINLAQSKNAVVKVALGLHKSKEPVSLDNMNENEKERNVVGSVWDIRSNERKQASQCPVAQFSPG